MPADTMYSVIRRENKIVFSQIPFSFSNRIICPTFLSISLTMDAYAAFGFICVLKPFAYCL